MISKRCEFIFQKIVDSKKPITIYQLSKEFRVSERTIRYDLDKIDLFLSNNNLQTLNRKSKIGISLKEADTYKKFLFDVPLKKDPAYYLPKQSERINSILNILLQSRSYKTINQLADELSVSRSTVIKDLKKVKELLQLRSLILESIPNHGLKIKGNEIELRRFAIECLIKTVDSDDTTSSVELIKNIKKEFLENNFKALNQYIDFIAESMKNVENQLGSIFSDEAYLRLIINIAFSINRIKQGNKINITKEELNMIENKKEFSIASNLATVLEKKFNIVMPINEIGYIAIELLGSDTLNNTDNDTQKEDIFYGFQTLTYMLIKSVSTKLNVDFTRDTYLYEGIYDHLRPLIYRIKNKLQVKNPLLKEMEDNYEDLFKAVKESSLALLKNMGEKISDEEIGYFTMHFAAALERQKNITINNTTNKKNILVVCNTGAGIARMLCSRVNKLFDVNIVATVAYHQVIETLEKENIDLVISNVELDKLCIPYIKVTPFLKSDDINLLEQYLSRRDKYNSTDKLVNIDKIISIIRKNCIIKNDEGLHDQLVEYLQINMNLAKKRDDNLMLKDVLTKDTIEANVSAKNWREAVRFGGKLLVKKGIVSDEYVDAMIKAVDEIGPYIVIAPGIAMPHARPESGVIKVGMSLITLSKPVNFGNKENDPVKIIICITSTDNKKHLNPLSELASILEKDQLVEMIKKASDKQQIVNVLLSNLE